LRKAEFVSIISSTGANIGEGPCIWVQGLFIFCVTIFILLDFCENFKYNIFAAGAKKAICARFRYDSEKQMDWAG